MTTPAFPSTVRARVRSKSSTAIESPSESVRPVLSSTERQALLSVVRQRERVAMADAAEYETTLIANFERKLATIYKPSDDPVWTAAHAAAEKTEREVRAQMSATFKALGIPEAWAPEIHLSWYGRGENASRERRSELRRMALTEAARRRKAAQAEIKRRSVTAQERILVAGLTTELAQTLLESLPAAKDLMPELELEAIEKIAAPNRRSSLRSALNGPDGD